MRHENIIWWELFEHLRRYAESFGEANVPSDYVTPDGFALSAWVGYVRSTYRAGLLSEEGKKALEQLPGWIWAARGARWFEKLACLRTYVARHGSANVPKKYVEKNGFKLGVWVSTQRYLFRCGKLQDRQRDLLEELPGWRWDPFSYKRERQWFARLCLLRCYGESFGDTNVPSDYVTPDGFALGAWVGHVRSTFRAGLLSEEAKKALEELPGWRWDTRGAQGLEKLACLRTYVDRSGTGDVPRESVEKNGFKLGAWVRTQRCLFRCGQLPAWKRDLLEELPGWQWDPFSYKRERQWFTRLSLLLEHVKAEGHFHVSRDFVTPEGCRLGIWLRDQKYLYKKGKLSELRRTALEQVPGWSVQDARLGRRKGS